MLKRMQDTGNKLEAKMNNLQETLSKEIQDIKHKQEEVQNTITEIKNSLEIANSRIQNTGRKTNKQGGGQMRRNHGCRTEKRKKIENKLEESLRELWDNVKHTNIHIIGVPEGEERKTDRKNIPRDNS